MKLFLASLLIALPLGVQAENAVVTNFDGSFDEATFSVESAIVGKGLVIDFVSHAGEMLNRTGEDVGSDKTIFLNADIFVFCSAVVSREVMEADPMYLAFCPYGIFVAETEDGVIIGRQNYPDGPMDKVEMMLDEIINDAVDG